jgi:hypothetical protein
MDELRLREFENSVLREISGPKRKWQEACKDYTMRSFVSCNASPNIIKVIITRRMRWAEHVACMGT